MATDALILLGRQLEYHACIDIGVTLYTHLMHVEKEGAGEQFVLLIYTLLARQAYYIYAGARYRLD